MKILAIVAGAVAGLILGSLFYGGLWLTVRRLPTSRHPALLALVSFWSRSAMAVAGLVLLAKQGWQCGLAGLVTFLLGRFVVARLLPDKEGRA